MATATPDQGGNGGTPTPSQKLREATHQDHVRLNRHPLLEGLTRKGYPADYYARVLVAYCHFYKVLESAIELGLEAGGGGFDYKSRQRLPWLLQDLCVQGIDPWLEQNQPTSKVGPIELDSTPKLVGALYTIEGSSLGGQVIARHLAANLNLTESTGARFFWGYGEKTNEYWQQFATYMESQLTDPDKTATAAVMAREIFKLLERVLDGYRYKHII